VKQNGRLPPVVVVLFPLTRKLISKAVFQQDILIKFK